MPWTCGTVAGLWSLNPDPSFLLFHFVVLRKDRRVSGQREVVR